MSPADGNTKFTKNEKIKGGQVCTTNKERLYGVHGACTQVMTMTQVLVHIHLGEAGY